MIIIPSNPYTRWRTESGVAGRSRTAASYSCTRGNSSTGLKVFGLHTKTADRRYDVLFTADAAAEVGKVKCGTEQGERVHCMWHACGDVHTLVGRARVGQPYIRMYAGWGLGALALRDHVPVGGLSKR